jgi:hypothetical protein
MSRRWRSYRGVAPSYAPHAGDISPASPLFESHPLTIHVPRFTSGLAERVGFEPTVPLPGRMLSKHVDSSTLAPLRADRQGKRIIARGILERQGNGGAACMNRQGI